MPLAHGNRTIIVAKDGTGDFTTIKAAQAAIGSGIYPTSGTDQRYVIKPVASADGTNSVFHEANPIPWDKQYVSLFVEGGHDAIKIIGDNDDDFFLISKSDCEFTGVNIRLAAPSTAGKAGFKMSGTADDIVFNDCKVRDIDIGWLNTVGDNVMRGCSETDGSGANFVKVTGGRFACYDSYCLSGLTLSDYSWHVTGAGSAIYLFNCHDESAGKVGCVYAGSSGFFFMQGGNFLYAVNQGVFIDSGIAVMNDSSIAYGTAIGLRVAGTGNVSGNISFQANGTYDVQSDTSTVVIEIASGIIDLTKTNLVAGTAFTFNRQVLSDQIYTNEASTFRGLGTFAQVLNNASVVAGGASANHVTPGNMYIVIKIETLSSAGTLRLTGNSYNPVTGTTTVGDTEDIAVTAAGQWFRSSKLWDNGATVVISGQSGISVTIDTYEDMPFANYNKNMMLHNITFEILATVTGNIDLYVTKFNFTSGYATLYSKLTMSCSANNQMAWRRTKLLDAIKCSAGEAIYIWWITGNTAFRRVKYRINFSSE